MRTKIKHFAIIGMVLSITACGQKAGEDGPETAATSLLTAATLGEQTVLTSAEYLAAEPYATADLTKGENLAQVCRACHSLEKDGPNTIGPALFGFFGSKVGSRSGFEYSPVLRNADFVWTPRALDAWLTQPGRFLPGNRMTFAGVFQRSDRESLIAYLLESTTAKGGQ